MVVKDLNDAVKNYNRLLDMAPEEFYVNEDEKLRVARYKIGEVYFEIMEDTTGDGDVARSIERRGEGLFLVSFKVPDAQEALTEAQRTGYRTIDEKPRPWRNSQYAFLHPSGTNGTLVEFIDGPD
jgi:methylmalonyl-CoA/ethylmalonyl-CoA epimerase